MMLVSKLALFALTPLVSGVPRRADVVVIAVHSDPADAGASLRIVASGGTVVAAGRTYRAGPDTIRVTSPAELRTTDPVMIVTFMAAAPTGRVSVQVNESSRDGPSGSGNVVIVVRTPMGIRLEAAGSLSPPPRRP
jgi:hypothetical protein